MTRSRFLCGDFVSYLRETDERFDVVLASGVLYHQREPDEVLELIGSVTDKVIIWTHYFDAELAERNPGLRGRFREPTIERERHGHTFHLHPQSYGGERNLGRFCGGGAPQSCWMERRDLLDGLAALGFTNQEVDEAYDQPEHPNGPALLVTAWR